jgi:hypothetical protein
MRDRTKDDGSAVFEPQGGWNIPPTEELSGKRPTTLDGAIEAQHRNFDAPFVGTVPIANLIGSVAKTV